MPGVRLENSLLYHAFICYKKRLDAVYQPLSNKQSYSFDQNNFLFDAYVITKVFPEDIQRENCFDIIEGLPYKIASCKQSNATDISKCLFLLFYQYQVINGAVREL